jgi:hypothetical protein
VQLVRDVMAGKSVTDKKSGVRQSSFVSVCRLFVTVEFWLPSTNFRRKSVKGKFFFGEGGRNKGKGE